MTAFVRQGDYAGACRVWAVMQQEPWRLRQRDYGVMVESCCKQGDIEGAQVGSPVLGLRGSPLQDIRAGTEGATADRRLTGEVSAVDFWDHACFWAHWARCSFHCSRLDVPEVGCKGLRLAAPDSLYSAAASRARNSSGAAQAVHSDQTVTAGQQNQHWAAHPTPCW